MADVRRRLDVELTRRRLADTREAARRLIEAGRVTVDGQPADKPARMVLASSAVEVRSGSQPDYASRGAHKLIGALDAFEPAGLRSVSLRRCLDAGASTGGFTDVLLRRGASAVIAADVGYGQLAWRLRTDERVHVMDRCNIRALTAADLPYRPDLVVADLSFISLRLVLPALTQVATDGADLVVMVKPQFEVGRDALGKGGVVRDPAAHADAVAGVVASARALDWEPRGVAPSPLPGPAGNREFFVWLAAGPGLDPAAAIAAIATATTPDH